MQKRITRYQTHPLSRWHGLRHATKKNHVNLLRQIDRRHGHVSLRKIKGRTLLKWHAEWLDGTKYSSARAFKKLSVVLGFGLTILEDIECARIRQVMSTLRFAGVPKGKQRLTAGHRHSVAGLARWLGLGGVGAGVSVRDHAAPEGRHWRVHPGEPEGRRRWHLGRR